MSTALYRLGHLVARRAGRVLVAWVVVLGVLGGAALVGGGQLTDDLSIPGTESQAGIDVLGDRFPELAGTSGQVLFSVGEGERVADHRAEIGRIVAQLGDLELVRVATDPFDDGPQAAAQAVSDDGRHALSQVQLAIGLEQVDDAVLDALEQAATDVPEDSALRVDLGGQVFAETSTPLSWTEAVGVGVALLVLALTLGSLLAAGIPIVTAVLGVGVAMAGLLIVSAFTTINTTTPTLALMIGLAVGIDYALFIVSRHRSQLRSGMGVAESVARSLATAGSAVIFAGVTVVIALCGLVAARIPFLTVMGFAAAGAVTVAVLIALTATPAILALAGERLRPRPRRTSHPAPAEPAPAARRWVALVTARPVWTLVVGVVALGALALPAQSLALALPDNGTAAPDAPERVTYDRVSEAFGPGFNSPLLVTVDIIRTLDPIGVMEDLAADLGELDGVDVVALATPNRTADLGIVQIVPETGQTDPATAELVREIRRVAPELEQAYDVTDLRVTGHTAVTIDISDRLSAALVPFGIVVVGLSLVLLTIVFRSIAVPIKATVGYLLSVAASFGAVALVFEHGFLAELLNVTRTGPVVSFLPIILMGVLFGLAMDYEVFLVSRMREEYVHGGDARAAVADGFAANARVVGAAAIIMIAVFASFVPHADAAVKPIALGLAVGVFVDAFVVRMSLVPAVLTMLGDRAWRLPRWLDRRLPVLDVEGTGVEVHVAHQEWVEEHGAVAVRTEDLEIRDERDRVVVSGVHHLVRPGELTVVVGAERWRRRALLAAYAGRLPIADGTLVVGDRVLPGEAAAVRRTATYFAQFPARHALLAWAEEAGPGALLLVDGLDADADAAVRADRWELLARIAALGVSVVTAAQDPPPGARRPVLDLGAFVSAPSPTPTEESSWSPVG
ncbi:MMPL family transporter [Nocardioides massiliensis]|uniref:RND superfamily putative drug exporter n=1 Tax=Nocardioides massiliensis TaxID=1325935 RepID=A0ABT9NL09_9ACTN|nr:MMPL family transporter [Nocardioides massiliensis]MDP9821106.1 RND superfamily putative drug exporter [Nocardioides massiliensis]